MTDLERATDRVVHESPTHGPVLLEEIARLTQELTRVHEGWKTDDHDARMVRFAVAEVETLARKTAADPALLEMVVVARTMPGKWAGKVESILTAAAEAQCGCTISQRESGHEVGCWMPALTEALDLFQEAA